MKSLTVAQCLGLIFVLRSCNTSPSLRYSSKFDFNSVKAIPTTATYKPPPQVPKTIDQLIMDVNNKNMAKTKSANQKTTGDFITAELDMNLTPMQYWRLYGKKQQRDKRKAVRDVRKRWTKNVIPYDFNNTDFDENDIFYIREALAEWESLTCLKFRPANVSDVNRIRFQNGFGCNSALGMIGGVQDINLQAPGCRFKGLYLHEVGHAIGLVHEHQLPNRDNYISVKFDNVDPVMRQWFNKYAATEIDLQGVDYEYSSVMHYGKTAFSKDGNSQTIFAKDRSKENEMGNVYSKTLAFSDVKAVNLMYKCNAHCKSNVSCASPCFLNKECHCFCKEDMPAPPCDNADGDRVCNQWAVRGECDENSEYMHGNCRKACQICKTSSNETGIESEVEILLTDESGMPGSGQCYNKYDNKKCNEWAALGECSINPEWMEPNCRKSCQKCQPGVLSSETTSTTRVTTTSTVSECKNIYGSSECIEWASGEQCEKNPLFMLINCRRACGLCNGPNTEKGKNGENVWDESSTGTVCEDKHKSCPAWIKYCTTNEYVSKMCLKTCVRCA